MDQYICLTQSVILKALKYNSNGKKFKIRVLTIKLKAQQICWYPFTQRSGMYINV